MSCQELVLPAEELSAVLAKGFLEKKSGRLFSGWHYRYCVVSCGMLYTYITQADKKPKKIIGLVGSTVLPETIKDKAFVFKLTTCTKKVYRFSAESQEQVDYWIRSIQNAPYTTMRARMSHATLNLARVRDILVPPEAGAGGKEDEDVEAEVDMGQLVAVAEDLKRAPSHSRAPSQADELNRAVLVETNARLAAALQEVDDLRAEVQSLRDGKVEDITGDEHGASVEAMRVELGHAQAEAKSRSEEVADLQARLAEAQDLFAKEKDRLVSQVAALESQVKSSRGGVSPDHAGAADWHAATSPTASPARVVPPLATSIVVASPSEHDGSKSSIAASSKDPYEHEWAPFYKEAQALEKAGRLAEAEQQYQVVLDIRRERGGSDSVGVATASRDLGRVLALQRKFDRAEEHYTEAVGLCTRLLGEPHPNTACALTDLAAVQREQGKFHQAEKHAERAVRSLRMGVGADDVSTATALYNLAGLAKRQGKYLIAEQSYAEALEIFKRKLGDGEGETADTMYQCGCLYRKRNEYARAKEFFLQAADAYAKAYGPTDRRVDEATKRASSMADKLGGGRPASGRPPSGSRRTGGVRLR